MITTSISNLNSLKVFDESDLSTYWGCNQEWYTTEWQRLSGCGPSVVSNIILYLTQPAFGLGQSFNTKENCLTLMEEIWEYVTPTKEEGIPTTKMLYKGVSAYAKAKKLKIEYDFCDLPRDKSCRPQLSEVLLFVQEALSKDSPIAFVNLCNGEVENLYRWHWVTIVSLIYTETEKTTFVTILDEGLMKKIDLALWYNTTTLGGGFIYFTPSLLDDDKE